MQLDRRISCDSAVGPLSSGVDGKLTLNVDEIKMSSQNDCKSTNRVSALREEEEVSFDKSEYGKRC